MSTPKEPQAEVKIDPRLIQQLLTIQCPQFSDLAITFLDAGWDNENYRLGEDYIIRMPRRQLGVKLLRNEINWLPRIQKQLPIPIPAPIFVGKAAPIYPWPWTIVPWVAGKTANLNLPNAAAAIKLAQFLKVLHQKNPVNAPKNDHRGISLKYKLDNILDRMGRLKTKTDFITPTIEKLLDRAISTPFPTEKYLLHGDLHPRNIIVQEGKIVSIIDWGDITDGDIATDLAIFWMLFPNPTVRQQGLAEYGVSEDLINRAIGWAIFYGVILLDTGLEGNVQHAEIGKHTLCTLEKEGLK